MQDLATAVDFAEMAAGLKAAQAQFDQISGCLRHCRDNVTLPSELDEQVLSTAKAIEENGPQWIEATTAAILELKELYESLDVQMRETKLKVDEAIAKVMAPPSPELLASLLSQATTADSGVTSLVVDPTMAAELAPRILSEAGIRPAAAKTEIPSAESGLAAMEQEAAK